MKDTLKTLELLEEHIDRLAENGIHEIERDLLLESLRRLYTSVISIDAITKEDSILSSISAITERAEEEEKEFDLSDNTECMYGCPPEEFKEIEEPIEEEPAEPENEEPIEEETIEEIVEEEVAEEEPSEEETPKEETPEEEVSAPEVGEEIDHEVLMSLYDDDEEEPTEEPEVAEKEIASEEPEVEEEPIVIEEEYDESEEVYAAEEEAPEEADEEPMVAEQSEPKSVVLGDVLATEQTTLADNFAERLGDDVATAASANISLRKTIGINDKFILLRDLFGGDNDYYETAIDTLDSFDNLDEAMLYIYDNFHWNPNSEGARLLMELLARKLF